MSLRLQLVLLFTAVLAATLLVASALGLRIGQLATYDPGHGPVLRRAHLVVLSELGRHPVKLSAQRR